MIRFVDDVLYEDLELNIVTTSKNARGDGYNPYRDSKGRFADGLTIQELEAMVSKEKNRELVEEAKKRLVELKKINEKYPGRKYNEGFEEYANRWLEENPEEAVKRYNERILAEFDTNQPNVVSADDAKFIIPGFEPERSADYHEPASAFVKKYYKGLLKNNTSFHLPVLFTAGGTGAGKSTALRGNTNHFDAYAAVYDGNMAGFESAVGKIDAALETGRTVEIVYVDRDPVTAFKYGVIPRIAEEGRAITIKDHMQTHLDSRDVFASIVDKYADNPNVVPRVIDNNGGFGEAHEVDVAMVAENVYNKNELRKELEDAAREAKEDGRITDEVYRLITNQTADTTSE